MPEALEIAMQIIENGITIVTLLAILNVLCTWYESRRKRLRYERIESKLDALMQKEGVTWIGQQNECHKALTSLRQLPQLYSADIYRAAYLFKRSVGKVKINKAWLSGVVAYILGQLALKYGFTWNDAWSDTVTDIIITFAIPLIVAFMNRTKEAKDEKHPTDTGAAV